MSEFDDIDFFRSGKLLADPYPYYEQLRERVPGPAGTAQDVVMVTGYDEATGGLSTTWRPSRRRTRSRDRFPGSPVPLQGRRRSPTLIAEHRDELPVQRPAPDASTRRSTPTHRGAQRLTRRRSASRRTRSACGGSAIVRSTTFLDTGQLRAHRRLRITVRDARDRRPARRPRGRPRTTFRRGQLSTTRPGAEGQHGRSRWPTPRWSTCTTRSRPTWRIAAAPHRRHADPGSPRPRSPTGRHPRSSTWSGSPRTSSPPARRPPCACSAPCSGSSPRTPTYKRPSARPPTGSRTSSRRSCGSRAPSRATSASPGCRRRSGASTSRPAPP